MNIPQKQQLLKEFEALRKKAELPNVVFHSLRHSSTTYKLKLNHGDLKATQGDTGHAQIDMITDIYVHILDEGRNLKAPQEEKQTTLDVASLIEQLQKSPELLQTLSQLISAKS